MFFFFLSYFDTGVNFYLRAVVHLLSSTCDVIKLVALLSPLKLHCFLFHHFNHGVEFFCSLRWRFQITACLLPLVFKKAWISSASHQSFFRSCYHSGAFDTGALSISQVLISRQLPMEHRTPGNSLRLIRSDLSPIITLADSSRGTVFHLHSYTD